MAGSPEAKPVRTERYRVQAKQRGIDERIGC